jgi:hypothetical protein
MKKAFFAALLLAAPLLADDATVTRLEAAGGTMSWSFVPTGRSEHFGHAEAIVAAPVDQVRSQATDFAHYKDLSNGRIRNSRLVDRRPDATDVYMQVPVLHGMITLWQVVRFTDVRHAADGTESFTGTLVHGNVRAYEMTVRIRRAGTARSVVECDLLVTPEFMAPQSIVDAELRDAATSVVNALARRAEQKYAEIAPAPTVTANAVAMQLDAGAP